MNLRATTIVYRKELVDSLRDRRTIISMVVIPILVFPLLMLGLGYIGKRLMTSALAEVQPVMISNAENDPDLTAALNGLKEISLVPAEQNFAEAISNKKIRAVVEIPPGFRAAIEHGQGARLTINYYEGDIKSELTVETLEKFFANYRMKLAKRNLEARHVPAWLLEPFTLERKNVAPPEKVGGSAFGMVIPYLVIVLCFTGAMYPAMDLTAGEKERGTIETILSSPVARTDLVFGKFLMVLTASLATAALSVLSMWVSFVAGKKMFFDSSESANSLLHATIDLRGVLAVFVMVLPLSVLFSAAILAVSLFAKTYREAQSYLTPMTMLVTLPAIMSFLPGLELNAKTALVPILNTSLVSKEIVAGLHPWGYIALVFGTSCLYAAAALAFAVWLFHRESVLFRN